MTLAVASGCAGGSSPHVAITQVVGGTAHTCALDDGGGVWCWGAGASIDGSPGVRPPTRLGLPPMRFLAAGARSTCGLATDETVSCWGATEDQTFTVLRENGMPLGRVNQLALGLTFGCASNPEGTFCWGQNDLGQLARPLTTTESPAALLAQPGAVRFVATGQTVLTHDGASSLCAWGHNGTHEVTSDDVTLVYTSAVCGTVSDVVQLVAGADHACVRHAAGSFACWGERYYGQLGLGGGIDDTADIVPYGSETHLAEPVAQLVAGASHTCALLAGGDVTCFGLNSKGQVGPGATTTAEEVRMPAPVTGFSGRVTVLGAGPTAQHTCAIIEDGQVQCWGSDTDGQLGDGVTTHDDKRSSHGPVTVKL